MSLSENEQKRYTRQMMIEGWGEEKQKKLKKSTVFIAGAGGLGSPVSIYLAVAGVGNIRICDFDSPDWSNLNRQILHDHTRIGTNKAVSAKMTLERLNPDITITAFTDKIVEENVDALVGNADIILDCMDNFPDALPAERVRHQEKDPARVRQHLGHRRPALVHPFPGDALPALHLPGGAAQGGLPGDRRNARGDRFAPGAGNAQVPFRHGPEHQEPAAGLGRGDHGLQEVQDPEGPRLPDLRRKIDYAYPGGSRIEVASTIIHERLCPYDVSTRRLFVSM